MYATSIFTVQYGIWAYNNDDDDDKNNINRLYGNWVTRNLFKVRDGRPLGGGGSVGAKMIFLHKRECITLLYSPTNVKKKLKLVES